LVLSDVLVRVFALLHALAAIGMVLYCRVQGWCFLAQMLWRSFLSFAARTDGHSL
jgi:hypothetical protein